MQGGSSVFRRVDRSAFMSESEDMVWDAAGVCLDLRLASTLNLEDVYNNDLRCR